MVKNRIRFKEFVFYFIFKILLAKIAYFETFWKTI